IHVVKFVTLEGPESVIALLRKHGFSNFQISKIVQSWPRILLADPEKNILPKLKFFSSIGMTGPDIAKIISSCALTLTCSLINRIVPVYKFLKGASLFGDEFAIKAMSRASRTCVYNVEKISASNSLLLREIGMPQSVIKLLLINQFVIDMGVCPTETKFIRALCAVVQLSESTRQHRVEVYGRYGWSKDEILMKPSEIAAYPHLFSFSLKKRTIPRGLVIKTLKLKGVVEKNVVSFLSVLAASEKRFLKT
ncbi:transcription termination factor MTEF1, chloroplastic-like, partial [Jatropha curcas]|uniref:transcription termination factor MTEF1, chloroplastic-like n=1 Tax=Jatropha curcas TaxID=180498 RepID=UPI001893F96B